MDNAKEIIKAQNINETVRLNKFLSDCGICSRRQADRLIEAGEILVNGKRAVLGTQIGDSDRVEYQGREIKPDDNFILIAFNKPRGVECTTDKTNPDNIVDYIGFESRIFPIGRLDKNSSGLILLTNTGGISDKILRGSNFHEKEYFVRVDRPVTDKFLEKMAGGVQILDTVTRPCRVRKTGKYTFKIILTQGLNRQIRRMCEALGYNVVALQRQRIMNIKLEGLETGKWRYVTKNEIDVLLKELYDGENGKN